MHISEAAYLNSSLYIYRVYLLLRPRRRCCVMINQTCRAVFNERTAAEEINF